MIEQTKLNGPVYYTREDVENGKKVLVSKRLKITEIEFGQPTNISVKRLPDSLDVLIVVENTGLVYRPKPDSKEMSLINRVDASDYENIEGIPFIYGLAKVDDELQPYFIQNQPKASIPDTPGDQTFELPPTVQGFTYNRNFTYPEKLIELLGDTPATNVDAYKRPLSAAALNYQRFFPTTLENVTTTFKDMTAFIRPLPIALDLNRNQTQFACVDLEPSATPEEKKTAESFDAYYVEDTPRGGKHYLVRVSPDTDVYKYRISTNLEVIVHAPITMYGINPEFLNDNPEIADFKHATIVGRKSDLNLDEKAPTDLEQRVQELLDTNAAAGNFHASRALTKYKEDKDESHADYMACLRLYPTDVAPYLKDSDSSPAWLLAGYVAEIIPPRKKHDEYRDGVPYLVYTATQALEYIKRQQELDKELQEDAQK